MRRDGATYSARRMLAIALLLEGQGRDLSARQSGMDRQTLRDWVHRYNAEGIAGLLDRPHGGGAPRKLTAMQESEVAGWVRSGPVLETDGVVRWRRSDLGRKIAENLACICMSAASASCCIGLVSGISRCARVTRRPIPRRRRRIKKLCHAGR